MPDQTPVKMSPDELALELFTTGQSMTGGRPEAERLLKQIKAAAVSSVGQAPTPNLAAAIASCPGYEAIPNPCRCPCYGCKHHCGAHNPDELTAAAPTPDRTALREAVAEVLRPHASLGGAPPRWEVPIFDGSTPSLPRISGWRPLDEVADAVLAVLPEPADRTAVLRDAAVFVEAMNEGCGGRKPCASCDAREDAAGELHRLADAAAVVSGRTADETQGEAEAQPSRHRWYVETRDGVADQWAPGTRFTERRAALERYEVLKQHHPTWKDGSPAERRIVRETTSYTVEPASAVGGAHSCRTCEGIDPSTCLMNPDRTQPPPMDPVHILGIGADETAGETVPPVHLGGRANAEDCPACKGTNPPYPFLCPGSDADVPAVGGAQQPTEARP